MWYNRLCPMFLMLWASLYFIHKPTYTWHNGTILSETMFKISVRHVNDIIHVEYLVRVAHSRTHKHRHELTLLLLTPFFFLPLTGVHNLIKIFSCHILFAFYLCQQQTMQIAIKVNNPPLLSYFGIAFLLHVRNCFIGDMEKNDCVCICI